MTERQTIGPGLGASEVAVALGLHPYKTRIELWLEKVGAAEGFTGNARTDWGLEVEPALRRWYAGQVGRPILVPRESLYHPELPWLRATPDGLVLDSVDAGLADALTPARALQVGLVDHGWEAKNVGRQSCHRWGTPGSDEVPIEYLFQAQQNLAVTGLRRWIVVACLAGDPPATYAVERDDELISEMLEGARRFWHLVETRTEPDIDGSEAWGALIAERYPFARDDYRRGSTEVDVLATRLHELRIAVRDLGAEEDELVNRIKAAIGESAGIDTAVGRITWKPIKPRTIVNWEAVAVNLAADRGVSDEDLEARVRANTKQSKASRPFNVPRSWSKET